MTTLGETAPVTAPAPALPDDSRESAATARVRAYARVRVGRLTALRQRAVAVAVGDDVSVWSDKPASSAELVRYARDGAWCASDAEILRLLGRLYCVAVAIPVTVLLDLIQVLVQRPGRMAAAGFLAFILWLVL